jgi:transposase
MLCHKASSAGGRVLKNPKTKGSTLRCFNCGREVPKSLATRIHDCPFCGVKLHRDYNSALDHLKDTVGLTGINACGDPASTTVLQRLAASGVMEAGTTCDPPQFRGVAGSPRL